MIIQVILLLAGLLLILCGANYLVEGSSSMARMSGISEFVIGLTIVGIGTSTPEMVVSFYSAILGKADLAVGNIAGSNIFNTALILGVTALISPLIITKSNIRRDIPMNIIAALLLVVMGLKQTIFGMDSNTIGRVEGAVLLALFVYYLYTSFKYDAGDADSEGDDAKVYKTGISVIMILGGLAGLIVGGQFFVNSATAIAEYFKVPDAFIAITLVAGGTSLPELATCIVAAVKGRGQLALGNILGSNISNILLIIGGSALIRPLVVESITPVDFGILLLLPLFLLACAYLFKKKQLDRVEGAILVAMEIAYMVWLFSSL